MGYVSMPSDLTGYAKIASGSYVGNNTVNRAIAHGLGVKPKLVYLLLSVRGEVMRLVDGTALVHTLTGADEYTYAVTAMDVTNFYVGNATSYNFSGNDSTKTYYWIGIV